MPSTLEKLRILGDAAKYDLCASTASPKKQTVGAIGSPTTMGICHSYLPDGRCISLLKVLLTNKCIHDCKYCINSTSNTSNCFKRQTVSFEPEELANLTMNFYLRIGHLCPILGHERLATEIVTQLGAQEIGY